MSIESEIQRLSVAKSDLASAIEEYGVSVASDATLDEYGNLVRSIAIPTALPNPNALTFTGSVSGTYDGSEAVTIEIPNGSGTVEVDSEITESSENPVTSAAIFSALAAKNDRTVHMWKRNKPTKVTMTETGLAVAAWSNEGTEDSEYFSYDPESGSVTVLKGGKYLLMTQLRFSTVTISGATYGTVALYINGVQTETSPFTTYELTAGSTTTKISFPTLNSVLDLSAGDSVQIQGKGHPTAGYTLTDTAGYLMLLYLGE